MLMKFVHWSSAWYNIVKAIDHKTVHPLLALTPHLSQLLVDYFFREEVTLLSEDASGISINGAPRPRDDTYNH